MRYHVNQYPSAIRVRYRLKYEYRRITKRGATNVALICKTRRLTRFRSYKTNSFLTLLFENDLKG